MAVVESKLKDGTLTLGTGGTQDVSCQIINARVNTSYEDDGSAQETLCGDLIPAGRKLSARSLAGTLIQDWSAPTSVIDYLYANELQVVDFEYMPAGATGPTLTGQVRLEVPAETYGGDVNTRITSDFDWPMAGPLTRTPPVATARAGSSSE